MKVKKWLGKADNCDLCKDSLTRFDVFYDARISGKNTWALMCKECFEWYGVGLGTGRGQEYDMATKEKKRG